MTGHWFSFNRIEGYPTHYEDQHTAAHPDILTSGLITAILIVFIAILSILPGYRSKLRILFLFSYTVLSLGIGGITLVCNYGNEWEYGEVDIRTPYKPGTGETIEGRLGLHVSLRGINITLKGTSSNNSDELTSEIIDYNEQFLWTWNQGRFGFGPNAGRISIEFREANIRGTPIPILQVAEYFTFDGEGIRFGRHYRLAGWYANFFMWCGFVSWVLANILMYIKIRKGAIFLTLTGIFQIIAILIWCNIRNPTELQVPFESMDGTTEVILRTNYASDFYLVLVNSIYSIILGLIIFILDNFYPEKICVVFGINPLSAFDEVILTREEREEEQEQLRQSKGWLSIIKSSSYRRRKVHSTDNISLQANAQDLTTSTQLVTARRRKSFGKSHFHNVSRSYLTSNTHPTV